MPLNSFEFNNENYERAVRVFDSRMKPMIRIQFTVVTPGNEQDPRAKYPGLQEGELGVE